MLKSRAFLYVPLMFFTLLFYKTEAQSAEPDLLSAHTLAVVSDCQKRISIEIFPIETCSVVASHLGVGEQLGGGPFEDGSFLIVNTDASKGSTARMDYLPPRLRSEIGMKSITESVKSLALVSEKQSYSALLSMGNDLWSRMRDVYCHYHPEEEYMSPSRQTLRCPEQTPLPDEKIVETTFDYVVVYKSNILLAKVADTAENSRPNNSNPPSSGSHLTVAVGCQRNVSFAVVESGQLVSLVPHWIQAWIAKNQKKYPGLCFSQSPNRDSSNFLVVLSTSQTAFNGLYPTLRTSTDTSVTPVSGSGMVTDNYGGMWNYTYNGTVTTTTTSTAQLNLPYTDTSNTLYMYGYDQQGKSISQRWHTITTRQGGDGANTLGYNLGATLGAIHFKERLLKSVLADTLKAPI